MNKRRICLYLLLSSLIFSILACNLTGGTVTPIPPANPNASSPQPANPEVTNPAVASVEPPIPGLSYNSIPSDPATFVSAVKDEVFPSNIGDNFQSNLYERPFQLDNTYRPDADITSGTLSDNGDWYYFSTQMVDIHPTTKMMDSLYGIEIDVNRDGRGEFLLWATPPYSTTWTKNNIQLLADKNGDVGGPHPLISDAPNFKGDGYETILFDRGSGTDQDAAWVRQSPASPTVLQIAVKKTSIGEDTFLWNAWTDFGLTNPAMFDYNDFFTAQQAGSPYASNPYFPLKALYGMDNTCRAAYGFTPTGHEPGICNGTPALATPTTPKGSLTGVPVLVHSPTDTPTLPPPPPPIIPGGISGLVSILLTPDQRTGTNLYPVYLFSGTCTGASINSTTPNAAGNYSFPNLPAGNYCVNLFYSGSPVQPGNPQTVSVVNGITTIVNFDIVPPG